MTTLWKSSSRIVMFGSILSGLRLVRGIPPTATERALQSPTPGWGSAERYSNREWPSIRPVEASENMLKNAWSMWMKKVVDSWSIVFVSYSNTAHSTGKYYNHSLVKKGTFFKNKKKIVFPEWITNLILSILLLQRVHDTVDFRCYQYACSYSQIESIPALVSNSY